MELRTALAPHYYTSEEAFKASRDKIFFKTWQYVCRANSFTEPGQFMAFTLFDQDLFVVRGRDGALRCFYNVCQHRGHVLVEGEGRRSVLVCPYHAWSYDLSGRLKAAPNARKMDGFDRSKICLTSVRLEVFLGFVFVNLDENARPMTELFPGVEEAAKELCPDIEDKLFAYEHEAFDRSNWLVAVENYNECYHCSHCHKSFAEGVIDPESYDIRPFGSGQVLRHSSKRSQSPGSWYEADSDYGSFYLFPGFSLQIYPGGVVNTYHWRPIAPDDTIVYRGWFSGDGLVDETMQTVIDLDRDTTFAEDLKLVKEVQRGLNSRGYRPAPLMVDRDFGINSEHSIIALHDWVKQAMEGPTAPVAEAAE